MQHYKPRWFQLAATVGAALAVLLLIETTLTYRYTSTRIARDQGYLQATEDASSLEHWLRREQIGTADRLQHVLAQMADDRSDEVAWMTVIDGNGQVSASAGRFAGIRPNPEPQRIQAALQRAERSGYVHETSGGPILIAVLPIMHDGPRAQSQSTPGEPADWRVLEIAIYLRGPQGVLHPLRRNLMISAIAAFALMAAMIAFLLQLKTYVRGKTLEAQLQQARAVQRRLLPEAANQSPIEFAGECVPADEVGGDFYDLFPTARGEIAIVLGDVSGKGLPAALRMGVVHGAIRALSLANESLARTATLLNELLMEKSSREFVTLFWGFYDPGTHYLRYVNAGHIPPVLVGSGTGEVRRLETGGPVLGLLAGASYADERILLDGEQTLIAYSDGLMEASSPAGEEFGDAKLLPLIVDTSGKAPKDVLQQIISEAVRFIGDGEFQDDLTIFVAKLARSAGGGDTKV